MASSSSFTLHSIISLKINNTCFSRFQDFPSTWNLWKRVNWHNFWSNIFHSLLRASSGFLQWTIWWYINFSWYWLLGFSIKSKGEIKGKRSSMHIEFLRCRLRQNSTVLKLFCLWQWNGQCWLLQVTSQRERVSQPLKEGSKKGGEFWKIVIVHSSFLLPPFTC